MAAALGMTRLPLEVTSLINKLLGTWGDTAGPVRTLFASDYGVHCGVITVLCSRHMRHRATSRLAFIVVFNAHGNGVGSARHCRATIEAIINRHAYCAQQPNSEVSVSCVSNVSVRGVKGMWYGA